jgi:hypothetical protein
MMSRSFFSSSSSLAPRFSALTYLASCLLKKAEDEESLMPTALLRREPDLREYRGLLGEKLKMMRI